MKGYFIFLIIINIGLTILRFAFPGFILMFLFWLIIPVYIIHNLGIIQIARSLEIELSDKILAFVSTLVLVLFTSVQYEFGGNGGAYIINIIYSFFTFGGILIKEPVSNGFLSFPVGLFIFVDLIISVHLLIKSKQYKKYKPEEIEIR